MYYHCSDKLGWFEPVDADKDHLAADAKSRSHLVHDTYYVTNLFSPGRTSASPDSQGTPPVGEDGYDVHVGHDVQV